jgi:16S rRNA (uracil1498-N3)-methyltransferase
LTPSPHVSRKSFPRIFVPAIAISGDRLTVTDPDELHHLLSVLRIRVGDAVECLDGAGSSYIGRVQHCEKSGIVLRIEERRQGRSWSAQILLAQALIKPEPFEWVVQKATELGVRELVPLVTGRCVVRPQADRGERKVVRWQRIAKEAAKQCGRSVIPRIGSPQPFAEFARTLDRYPLSLIPTLGPDTVPLGIALEGVQAPATLALLIGPEGDFTQEEVELARRHGARPVSLGPLTLRSETAAIAAVAILQHTLGAL